MKKSNLALAISLCLVAGSATAASVSATFVDSGVFTHLVDMDGASPDRATRFISKNGSGDYQFNLAGSDTTSFSFGGFSVNIQETRNNYFMFDVSAVTEEVTAATFRFWGAGPGVLRSAHDLTLQLNSVDNYSASDIMNTPFAGDPASDVAWNISILNDLGDGSIYGSRLITAADGENPGLMPSPFASPGNTDCSDPTNAICGRWLEVTLNADALADINATTGIFMFGGSVPDTIGVGTEQIMSQTAFDLSTHPEHRTPLPHLELTVVPVPAAVWLFGSGLIGLVAIARRKKATTV